jgi:hypothetical protein
VDDRILGAYHWILAPEWPQSAQSFTLTATKAEGAAASLAERVSKRMITDSTLNTERAASLIRLDIANHLSTLWEERGHISVEELWGYHTDYPYMPRLRDRDVLDTGIRGFSQGHKAFKHLQPQVYAPGIVPLSDIQLLEGMADVGRKFGNNPDIIDLIAKWRTGASKYGLASLQLFLLSQGSPALPLSDHILTNSRKVIQLLDGG